LADKDVDEQFAAIMAHWHEDALGLDPFGDPQTNNAQTNNAQTENAQTENAQTDTSQTDTSQTDTSQTDTSQTKPETDPQGPEGPDPADRSPGQVGPDAGDVASTTTALRDTGAAHDQVRRAADEPTPATPTAAASAVNPAPRTPMTPEQAAGLGWRQHVPEPEPEDHFVPPPPAPLPPAEDKHFWLMMAGLIGGPLLFLYLILFNRDGNGWWMVCGIVMTLAGFVLLVLRQPFERDEDDDGVRL